MDLVLYNTYPQLTTNVLGTYGPDIPLCILARYVLTIRGRKDIMVTVFLLQTKFDLKRSLVGRVWTRWVSLREDLTWPWFPLGPWKPSDTNPLCLFPTPPPSLTSFTYIHACCLPKLDISYSWSLGYLLNSNLTGTRFEIMCQYPDWRPSPQHPLVRRIFAEYLPNAMIILSVQTITGGSSNNGWKISTPSHCLRNIWSCEKLFWQITCCWNRVFSEAEVFLPCSLIFCIDL